MNEKGVPIPWHALLGADRSDERISPRARPHFSHTFRGPTFQVPAGLRCDLAGAVLAPRSAQTRPPAGSCCAVTFLFSGWTFLTGHSPAPEFPVAKVPFGHMPDRISPRHDSRLPQQPAEQGSPLRRPTLIPCT